MDSLTRRGCVTLWKSGIEPRLPTPRVEERASKSAYLPKTSHRARHRKTLVSVNARDSVGFRFLEITYYPLIVGTFDALSISARWALARRHKPARETWANSKNQHTA
jgi:hypothetical protein